MYALSSQPCPQRLMQNLVKLIMVGAGWVHMRHIVLRKHRPSRRVKLNAELLGSIVDQRVAGQHEAMPKSRGDEALIKQLTHELHAVDGLLISLGRKPVHQIGVD